MTDTGSTAEARHRREFRNGWKKLMGVLWGALRPHLSNINEGVLQEEKAGVAKVTKAVFGALAWGALVLMVILLRALGLWLGVWTM